MAKNEQEIINHKVIEGRKILFTAAGIMSKQVKLEHYGEAAQTAKRLQSILEGWSEEKKLEDYKKNN